VHCLQTHTGGTGLQPVRLRVDRGDGLLQLVVVDERRGEPADRVDPEFLVQAVHRERLPQVPDRRRGRGEKRGAAQLVEHARVDLGKRRFHQGTLQTAAGRVGGADGEVLAGCLSHLLDEFGVVVRMYLEEVPGGRGGAETRRGDDRGGHAVHRGAQRVRDRAVDGGGDERMDELQVPVVDLTGRLAGLGEDARRAEERGTALRLVLRHSGEFGRQFQGDLRAEDGRRPGEPGGVHAEPFEPVDESTAACRAVQRP
jgi:hypothetical protein